MRKAILAVSLLSVVSAEVHAQVPFTFQTGQTARAAEVNANFDAMITAITTLEATVSVLESTLNNLQTELSAANATISTLQGQVTGINNSNVMALEPYVSVIAASAPRIQFVGVNLQLINGMGETRQVNGLGNLIVGYDEPRTSGSPVCSDGFFETEIECLGNGDVWALSHKSGSHNIVGGARNSYSAYGGLVVGEQNAVNGRYSSITGGEGGVAYGPAASISGGRENVARGPWASVSGGRENLADGFDSSVSGGRQNIAIGNFASVSGGRDNVAANGAGTSVSGGSGNVAEGLYTSVSGGRDRTVAGMYRWAAGSLIQDN